MDSKKKIITGMAMIAVALLFFVAIFYSLVNAQARKAKQIKELKEEMLALDTEASAAREKAGEMESEIGKTLYLKSLMEEAEQKYGPEEKNRKEGRLWIDRKNKVIIATLGVVNGVFPGSRLAVYDDGEKAGEVTVDIPMDVISYIRPADFLLNQFDKDYFRVVKEE